ncbi:MAG: DUF4214 domain-containing protein [Sulfitobacter sp.]
MINITFFGNTDDYFHDAFDDLALVSYTSTSITVLDATSGFRSILSGVGFAEDSSTESGFRGTITGISTVDSAGAAVLTATDLNWEVNTFDAAIEAYSNNNGLLLTELLSTDDITLDASAASEGIDLGNLLRDVTSYVDVFGSDHGDVLYTGTGSDVLIGGAGDDYINPGDNTDFDYVDAHTGDDTIDAGDIVTGYLDVDHWSLTASAGQTINVDGTNNTVSILKGASNGTTTISDANNAMLADGLGIGATELDDVFNVDLVDGGWLQLSGGGGNDVFNIDTGTGLVRLDYRDDARGDVDATSGLVLNLSTGLVSNDGFGGVDRINAEDDARIEIRGTHLADVMTGGDGDDRFISEGGNDTISGGAGEDIVRYDRSGLTAGVTVDLKGGTATGTWDGVAFSHTLNSIEWVRGSDYGDSMSGDTGTNVLGGRGGDDFLYGDGIQANLTGDVAGQVFRMYQATLARAPDAGGYENWVAGLFEGSLNLVQMASGFVNSTEFQNTYGSLDNTGFVELLYQNVLGRAADAGGLQNWLDEMDAGTTREGVVLGFSQSLEFQNSTAAESQAFAISQSEAVWTDEIYRVYRATLNRDPDIDGFLNWADALGSGTEFDTMINGFVRSTEFQIAYGSLDNTGFVELLYQNVLGRAADAGGLQNWLDAMDAGTTRAGVVRGFSQASEFQSGTAADLKAWVQNQGRHDAIEGDNGTNMLSGGLLADHFYFDLEETGTSTIMDFESWDELYVFRADYGDFGTFSSHLSQQGDDLVFADEGLTIVLTGVDTLTEDQVFF